MDSLWLVLALVFFFLLGNCQTVFFANFIFDFEHSLKFMVVFVLWLVFPFLPFIKSEFFIIAAVKVGSSKREFLTIFWQSNNYFLILWFFFTAHSFEFWPILKFFELFPINMSAVYEVCFGIVSQSGFIAVFSIHFDNLLVYWCFALAISVFWGL